MPVDVVELTAALIRNACVNDGTPGSGQEWRSVETLGDYLGTAGEVFEPHPGRQSCLYRVPGRVPGAPALMLMGHTDVVPVSPDGWDRDPFGGEVVDGVLWGRGAIDMLNVTAAMAVAFKPYLTGEAEPLGGDLIYLAVADEEGGGFLGAQWLWDHHPEALACDYLLTEIAYPAVATAAGPAQPVTVGEKGPAWRRIRAGGVPGHGSQPHGRRNAVIDLGTAISRLAAAPTPVLISAEFEAMVDYLGLDEDTRAMLLDPDRVDEAIAAVEDPAWARLIHALTHMTVSPNVVHGGVKANVVADAGSAEVDIRTLPGQDDTTVDDHLRKALGHELYDRLHIEPIMDYPPTASEPEGLLWEAIGDGLEAVAGSRRRFPTIISGTTDGRFFRSRGIPTYSVALFEEDLDHGEFLDMFHGHNERVSVEALHRTAALYAATLEAFGRRSVSPRS